MRILIVTEHFWPEAFRVNDLASGLSARGHEVTVLTGIPNYPAGRYFDGYGLRGPFVQDVDGAHVLRVPVIPRGRGSGPRLLVNYASYVACASAWLAVRRTRWDVVLVFQPTPVTTILPALVAKARGVPIVTWILDLWPDTLESTGMLRWPAGVRAAARLSAWLYRCCDLLLGQSQAYRARLEEMGVPPERIRYLPSWAEDLYESPPAARPSGSAEPWEQAFSVMFAGNLGRVQSLHTVLSAAELLEKRGPCHWVFLGDGAMRPWLVEEVQRRGLQERVHLIGRRPVEEMPAWYGRAGAMLVSLNREPILSMTIPGKVQSYLAAGRPIIGSLDGEGARVIEDSGAGYVAPAEDSESLAQVVERMMALSPGQRAEMGARGRAYYRANFARSEALDRVEAALNSVIRPRVAGAGPAVSRQG